MTMIGGVQGAEDLRYPIIKQIATDALKIDERWPVLLTLIRRQ